jgi:hypothetical protein
MMYFVFPMFWMNTSPIKGAKTKDREQMLQTEGEDGA